jgi:hypothetical protein
LAKLRRLVHVPGEPYDLMPINCDPI